VRQLKIQEKRQKLFNMLARFSSVAGLK